MLISLYQVNWVNEMVASWMILEKKNTARFSHANTHFDRIFSLQTDNTVVLTIKMCGWIQWKLHQNVKSVFPCGHIESIFTYSMMTWR